MQRSSSYQHDLRQSDNTSISAYPIQSCSKSMYSIDELNKDRTVNIAADRSMDDVTPVMLIPDYVESRSKRTSVCTKSYAAIENSRQSRRYNNAKCHINRNKIDTDQTNQSNSNKRKLATPSILKKRQKKSRAEPIEVTSHDILCRSKLGVTKITNSSTSIGNNRINVSINMHLQRYYEADSSGRLGIACEIVSMAKEWGRFVRKESDSTAWFELTCNSAIAAVVRDMNKSVKLVGRQSSTPTIITSAPEANNACVQVER